MKASNETATDAQPREVKVWDPLVRIGHWVIVIGVLTAYFTGDEQLGLHVWAGYVVAAAVVIRILWGFVGTRYARFSSFVRGPGAAVGYVRGLADGSAKRTLGHNPAGAVMIILLLVSLAGTTGTGMALYAVEDGAGPLAGIIAQSPEEGVAAPVSPGLTRSGDDDDDDDGPGERREHAAGGEAGDEEGGAGEWLEDWHKIFVYLTLGLAALHVIGVIVSSLAHGENLVRSMVNGRKRAE
ncbi:cytochrome b/b6 domain-containing protein [Maricaulis sp.]|uniref:cytochrome b/b6 domain-containing protein n=1 Tax=Maricaulis sp. TaxID=1486257 RepID=UPI003A938F04